MRRTKKLAALFLIPSVMASAVLGGCGNNSNQNETTTKSPSSGATTAAGSTENTSTPNTSWELLESLDKKEGDPLTLPRSNYISYPVDQGEATQTLRYWTELQSNVSKNSPSSNETEWAKLLQEETGIKIEFIHPTQGSSAEEFGVMIASGVLPDIIEWEWTNSYTGGPSAAAKEGVLTILDDYIRPDGPAADLWQYLQDNPAVDREIKTDDGSYYCFPFVRGDKYLQTTSGPMYRADIFEKAGYTGSLDTIEDWTAALTAVKEYGVQKPLAFQDVNYMMNFGMGAYGIRSGMYLDDKTKEVKHGAAEEGYKQWIMQMNDWMNAGLLDSEVMTKIGRSTLDSQILTGVTAATYGMGGGYMGTYLTTAASDTATYGEDFDIRAANFPVLNKGDVVKYSGGSYNYATGSKAHAVITEDCKVPELAAKLLNFNYSEKGHRMINFGKEGVSYTMVNNIPTYTDEIMKNPNGLTVAVAMAHWGRGNMNGPFVQDPNYIVQYYQTEQQKEALSIWNDETDNQGTLIPPITLTEEESKRYTNLNSQIDTYITEQRTKFITGEADVEAEWDNYISTLKSLGIDEMISIYQGAVDRYNAR